MTRSAPTTVTNKSAETKTLESSLQGAEKLSGQNAGLDFGFATCFPSFNKGFDLARVPARPGLQTGLSVQCCAKDGKPCSCPKCKAKAVNKKADKDPPEQRDEHTDQSSSQEHISARSPSSLQKQSEQTESANQQSSEINTRSLIVDDSTSDILDGQMRRTEFLQQLRTEVHDSVGPALTTESQPNGESPYLNSWLSFYEQKTSEEIEATIKRSTPDHARVTDATQYISLVRRRALHAANDWSSTGNVSDVPQGLPSNLTSNPPQSAKVDLVQQPKSTTVMAKPKEGGVNKVDDADAIQIELGQGQALASDLSSRMESAFGVSFSHVRTHTDSKAAEISNRVNARAFTVGSHVAFNTGEYQPGTLVGDALIAHELAHTIQQQNHSAAIGKLEPGDMGYDALEKDADHAAEKFVSSLWSGKSGVKEQTQKIMPNLRSGLRLQRCGGSQTRQQSAAPRAADPCPTSVVLEGVQDMTEAGLDRGYRTGYGITSVMHLLPDTTDWSSARIFERVTLGRTSCPEAWNMCTGGPNPFPINQETYSTILGNLPARRNRFYDFHVSRWTRSRLHDSGQNPSGMDSCTVSCNQSYVCGDRVLGRFVITRNFRKAMRGGREVTIVDTTKTTA
jgi:hypothetical protein